MRVKMNPETITVRLRPDLDAEVRRIADREGNNISGVVRRLIAQGLKAEKAIGNGAN